VVSAGPRLIRECNRASELFKIVMGGCRTSSLDSALWLPWLALGAPPKKLRISAGMSRVLNDRHHNIAPIRKAARQRNVKRQRQRWETDVGYAVLL
jgi:hypothetical protein